jgi:hypothetical protein
MPLKKKALDRLAEVLARFKTARPRGRSGVSEDSSRNNLDAKHVTAVVLIENVDSVAIVCAKNEGLDPDDVSFLQELCELLRKISRLGI